ncbi:lysozyme inhibitor LprI family protein [uncultured Marinobacter sp.]|uniref:lysozyme inhibitor LprI family protein n=1 Tax=uncultured Marinobacter sp. TaxID=187379 RepID=UPI00344EA0B1
MNNCTGEMLEFYEDQLDHLYSIQMNHLQTESRKMLFKEAQLAWKSFRDKDCLYSVGKRENSGSIWPAARNACLAERTKSRVEQLEAYVACRDNGCPY